MNGTLTVALFALVAAAAVVLDRVNHARGSPTLGGLARALTARRVGRWVLLLGWAWLGWHLFARGTVAFLH